jgi:hypothetical protein
MHEFHLVAHALRVRLDEIPAFAVAERIQAFGLVVGDGSGGGAGARVGPFVMLDECTPMFVAGAFERGAHGASVE